MADVLIYHYTSAAGLKGIIEEQAIHCTNNLFLNDSLEYHHSYSVITGILSRTLQNSAVSNQCKASVDRILQNIKFAITRNAQDGFAAPFIASFSKARDQLSQWRGYCSSGGYSLGFDVSKLQTLLEPIELCLVPVNYVDERSSVPDLENWIQTFIKKIQSSISQNGSNIPLDMVHSIQHLLSEECQHPPTLQGWEGPFVKELWVFCYSMMPFYKHPSFKEEEEQRVALLKEFDAFQEIPLQFKHRGNVLVPYLNLKLNSSYYPFHELVKEIIIGPCNHPEQTELGLRLFLDSHELKDVEIKHSKIPYRNMG